MEIEASERRIYEDKISHPEEKKLALLRVTGPTSFVFHAHQHLTPTSTSESLRQKLEVQLYSEFQASSSTKHHPKTPTNHQPKHTQPLRVYTQPDTDIMGCTPSKTPLPSHLPLPHPLQRNAKHLMAVCQSTTTASPVLAADQADPLEVAAAAC